nr:DivIVA domain-containing protein [Bacilli bacterium]
MKKFDKSFNGYNVEQVNAFVDEVIVQVDDMITRMKEKDLEIDRLNKELVHYKDMEATINRAVMIAQDAANKYKENSLNESDLILVEAKKNANRIINDALLKAEHLEEDAARIRRNIIT